MTRTLLGALVGAAKPQPPASTSLPLLLRCCCGKKHCRRTAAAGAFPARRASAGRGLASGQTASERRSPEGSAASVDGTGRRVWRLLVEYDRRQTRLPLCLAAERLGPSAPLPQNTAVAGGRGAARRVLPPLPPQTHKSKTRSQAGCAGSAVGCARQPKRSDHDARKPPERPQTT